MVSEWFFILFIDEPCLLIWNTSVTSSSITCCSSHTCWSFVTQDTPYRTKTAVPWLATRWVLLSFLIMCHPTIENLTHWNCNQTVGYSITLVVYATDAQCVYHKAQHRADPPRLRPCLLSHTYQQSPPQHLKNNQAFANPFHEERVHFDLCLWWVRVSYLINID